MSAWPDSTVLGSRFGSGNVCSLNVLMVAVTAVGALTTLSAKSVSVAGVLPGALYWQITTTHVPVVALPQPTLLVLFQTNCKHRTSRKGTHKIPLYVLAPFTRTCSSRAKLACARVWGCRPQKAR